MGRTLFWVIAVAAIAGLLAWNFYFQQRRDAPLEQAIIDRPRDVQAGAESRPDLSPEPPPRFEAGDTGPAVDEVPELPALEDSDPLVLDTLKERFSGGPLESLLLAKGIIRNVVVTVDNLPREIVSMKVRALGAAPDRFRIVRENDQITLAPDNYERYAPFMELLAATDLRDAVDLYIYFYPLLQEAFEDLGYPGKQFNTRVLEVIDHLLETPEASAPLRLSQPHVLYEFADQELESRSAGQKMLLRAGERNAALAKDWLRRFRAELQNRLDS